MVKGGQGDRMVMPGARVPGEEHHLWRMPTVKVISNRKERGGAFPSGSCAAHRVHGHNVKIQKIDASR